MLVARVGLWVTRVAWRILRSILAGKRLPRKEPLRWGVLDRLHEKLDDVYKDTITVISLLFNVGICVGSKPIRDKPCVLTRYTATLLLDIWPPLSLSRPTPVVPCPALTSQL